MPPHRRYSAKTRAETVGIALVEGVTEAERRTGIAKNTIQYWTKDPEFVHLRTTARETVVVGFWVGIQVGLREVVAGLKGDAPLHHKAAALNDLVEKYALLNGEATSRTENVSITDGLDDHEKDALHEAIVGELARRSDESPADPALGTAGPKGAETPGG